MKILQEYASALQRVLESEFPYQLQVTVKKDFEKTGRFEVSIVSINKLIHSKILKGQVRCDQYICNTPAEVQQVVDQIQDYLDSQ